MQIVVNNSGLDDGQYLRLMQKLDKIERKIERSFNLEVLMANELDDIEAKETANTDAGDGMMNLLTAIKAALDAAGTDKVRLAALSTKIGDNTARWTAATLANTAAAADAPPVEPPVPPPAG